MKVSLKGDIDILKVYEVVAHHNKTSISVVKNCFESFIHLCSKEINELENKGDEYRIKGLGLFKVVKTKE